MFAGFASLFFWSRTTWSYFLPFLAEHSAWNPFPLEWGWCCILRGRLFRTKLRESIKNHASIALNTEPSWAGLAWRNENAAVRVRSFLRWSAFSTTKSRIPPQPPPPLHALCRVFPHYARTPSYFFPSYFRWLRTARSLCVREYIVYVSKLKAAGVGVLRPPAQPPLDFLAFAKPAQRDMKIRVCVFAQ